MNAANAFVAQVNACISPVKCKLISSIGTTCAYPPPQAPPLMPITGPNEGSRSAIIDFLPNFVKASANPIVTVDFPSPAGVGLIAVTNTNLPFFSLEIRLTSIFALYFP